MSFDAAGNYYPIAHFEEFWLLRDKMIMLNESVSNVTLQLELKPLSFWWWQLQLQASRPPARPPLPVPSPGAPR
jgi:hypothetical protein